jgi:hypothetical protein
LLGVICFFVLRSYAKLHKSYENISGGFTECALKDLTGQPVGKHLLDSPKAVDRIDSGDLWDDLDTWMEEGFISCQYQIRKNTNTRSAAVDTVAG